MSWERLLMDAGLSEREVNTVMVLSDSPNMKASEIAKKLLQLDLMHIILWKNYRE